MFQRREPAVCNFPHDDRRNHGVLFGAERRSSAGYATAGSIAHLHLRVGPYLPVAARFTDGPIQPIYSIPRALSQWTTRGGGPYGGRHSRHGGPVVSSLSLILGHAERRRFELNTRHLRRARPCARVRIVVAIPPSTVPHSLSPGMRGAHTPRSTIKRLKSRLFI